MPAPLTKTAKRAASRPARPGRGVAVARERGNFTNTNEQAALVSEDKPLTEMQRLFVKHWAAGDSLTTAYIRAGYEPAGAGYAYRMAHMPNILALYNEEKRAYERDAGVTRKEVIEGFRDAIAQATMLGEPSSAIAGWREIGKMCGYYEPVQVKVQHSHEGKIIHERMDRMTDEQLAELIAARAQQMLEGVPNAGDETPDQLGSGSTDPGVAT